ncbi:MAG: hypothetical protein A4C66_01770 [Nitrospira sp. HN-bin3]|nr:MAG: hypothetical protein A4C66_01770 [Nitrospira sp. HN-bin3]
MINPELLSRVQENQGTSSHPVRFVRATFVRETDEYATDCLAPGWWFQNFSPLWKPLVYWIRRQRHMTLSEFQLVTSRMSSLTAIEKTIVVSAFLAYKNMQP